jgi:hypothetical protein
MCESRQGQITAPNDTAQIMDQTGGFWQRFCKRTAWQAFQQPQYARLAVWGVMRYHGITLKGGDDGRERQIRCVFRDVSQGCNLQGHKTAITTKAHDFEDKSIPVVW